MRFLDRLLGRGDPAPPDGLREEEVRWLGFHDTEPREPMPLGSRLVRIAPKHGCEARG